MDRLIAVRVEKVDLRRDVGVWRPRYFVDRVYAPRPGERAPSISNDSNFDEFHAALRRAAEIRATELYEK